MSKIIFSFLIGTMIVVLFSLKTSQILFPSDNLYLFPSYSQTQWKAPANSLLIDPVFQFEPWRHYAKQRIRKGEIPLWNNLNAKGVPFLANPQTAIFYPINVFYYLFPSVISLNLIAYTKLFLFGFFCYLYLKILRVQFTPLLIGVFTAIFSGFSMVWLLWPHTNAFIFFPLLFYITERILHEKKASHRWYALLSSAYFIALLGGHPETLFHMAVVHFIYTVVRLKSEVQKIANIIGFTILGLLLGSFQILPFLEYLQNSRAFILRDTTDDHFFLPIQSFIMQVIPFVFGAPHLPYYKAITTTTNFQETIGGYMGVAMFVIALFGVVRFWHSNFFRFFGVAVIIFWLLAYKVWPFWLLTQLPLFNKAGNSRLVGFVGFFLAVVAVLALEKIVKNKLISHQAIKNIVVISLIGLSVSTLSYFFLRQQLLNNYSEKVQDFLTFLFFHVSFLIISTTLFFFFVFLLQRKKSLFITILLLLVVLSQSLLLFWNYAPLTSYRGYYPQTELVKQLHRLPQGTILEVGNFNLPPNINLMYNLSHAENDDALQVREYRINFDRAFPKRNHWNIVDTVTIESLQRFGIRYIITDFDPNLQRERVQPRYDQIISFSVPGKALHVPFVALKTNLEEVRLLTANFNRLNTCRLVVGIADFETREILAKNNLDCKQVRDKMFYTLPLPASLKQNRQYFLSLESFGIKKDNAIGLWADRSGTPYLELLYQSSDVNTFVPLWRQNNVALWEVPNVEEVVLDGEYTVLKNKPEEINFDISAKRDGIVEVKQTYYPGWQAMLDGQRVEIKNVHPFVGIFVPKGGHVLTLSYRPMSFSIGLLASCASFFGLIIYFIFREWKENWKKSRGGKKLFYNSRSR